MTICIAAIAYERLEYETIPILVTACDRMVSYWGGAIEESTLKVEPIHEDWSAMMAANDLTQCVPIIEQAKRYFHGRANTLRVARSSFKRAYQRHVEEIASDQVLGRYGLTVKEFLKNGRRKFTEAKFGSLCAEIEQIKGQCEFLIHGFDSDKEPHLFIVRDPGIDSVYDKPGFCSIGSGKWAADHILYSLNQTIDCTVRQTIFNVLAAKFTAERVSGVGKSTWLYLKKQNRNLFGYVGDIVEEVRTSWEKDGCPRRPPDIIKRLNNIGLSFFTGGFNSQGETL